MYAGGKEVYEDGSVMMGDVSRWELTLRVGVGVRD